MQHTLLIMIALLNFVKEISVFIKELWDAQLANEHTNTVYTPIKQ